MTPGCSTPPQSKHTGIYCNWRSPKSTSCEFSCWSTGSLSFCFIVSLFVDCVVDCAIDFWSCSPCVKLRHSATGIYPGCWYCILKFLWHAALRVCSCTFMLDNVWVWVSAFFTAVSHSMWLLLWNKYCTTSTAAGIFFLLERRFVFVAVDSSSLSTLMPKVGRGLDAALISRFDMMDSSWHINSSILWDVGISNTTSLALSIWSSCCCCVVVAKLVGCLRNERIDDDAINPIIWRYRMVLPIALSTSL